MIGSADERDSLFVSLGRLVTDEHIRRTYEFIPRDGFHPAQSWLKMEDDDYAIPI